MLRGPGGLDPILFGAGKSGSLSGFVDFTIIAGDIYAEDITIDALVYGGGCRWFARDFIKVVSLGVILGKGEDAVGANGGAGSPGYTCGPGTAGGTAVSVSPGGVGVSPQVALGGRSAAGTGGDSSGQAGGAGGTPVIALSSMMDTQWNIMSPMLAGAVWDGTTIFGIAAGGCGGGAGGSSDLFPGHIGGGGGGGGGAMVLAAPLIVIDTGYIDFRGGNGADAVALSGSDDCGGGMAGSGGSLQLVYGDLRFENGGTILIDGGDGGDGVGVGGLGGSGGAGGYIYHYTNKYLPPGDQLQTGSEGAAGADGT